MNYLGSMYLIFDRHRIDELNGMGLHLWLLFSSRCFKSSEKLKGEVRKRKHKARVIILFLAIYY